MSYIAIAHEGLKLLDQRDWDGAIDHLTQALKESANPTWIIGRTKALVGAGRFREALEDAELAWHMAADRAKRELIVDAQHRRAVAHYRLGEFANADCCCLFAMYMIEGTESSKIPDPAKTFTDDDGFWTQTLEDAQVAAKAFKEQDSAVAGGGHLSALRRKQESDDTIPIDKIRRDALERRRRWNLLHTLRVAALTAMGDTPAKDPSRRCTVTLTPPRRQLSDLGSKDHTANTKSAESEAPTAIGSLSRDLPVRQGPGKEADVKLQEYQTPTNINVTILSKGVDKNTLKVDFQPSTITLDPIVYPGGEVKEYVLRPWADVIPEDCSYVVTPSKVELRLKKSTQAKWPSIVRDETSPKETDAAKVPPRATTSSAAGPSSSNPQQPTSSAVQPKKNWDSIEYDEEEEESDVNGFFKKIFKNATPEQQRAMMKSFTESSGTSLSTDWDDVKGRTVEAVPPDGVEAKKWT